MNDISSALAALADRCEQATGPSPVLNDEIHSLLNPGPSRWQRRDDRRAASPLGYTGSLDAATGLVPEGATFGVYRRVPGEGAGADVDLTTFGNAVTPELAVCAAALRFHAAKPEEAAHV